MNAMRPGLPTPLIDLIGARWSMGAPVGPAAWFGSGDSAVFGLADGTVAIARAHWDGAAQIQPREGGGVELVPASEPPPPVTRIGVHSGPCLSVAAADGVVLSGGADGRFAAIDADGAVTTLARLAGTRISHVAAADGSQACASESGVHRFGTNSGVIDLGGAVGALAFDPAGRQLAIAHSDGVALWGPGAPPRHLAGADLRALAWSADGQYLVGGATGLTQGWRLPGGEAVAFGACAGSPLPSYSYPGGFFATSGSARVVCWRLSAGVAVASECGVGSSVAVTHVACHPRRQVIAAGYENGAVLLCQPDSAEILFVRAAGGGAVTTLAWSGDGGFLALGAAGGEIGVVAFPERLFRPDRPSHSGSAAQ